MALVRPEAGRATITEGPGGLRISIPAKRRASLILFVPVFLAFWTVGIVMVVRQLNTGRQGFNKLFLAVWLILAVGFSVPLILAWLWNMLGSEIVRVSAPSLTISKSLFGLMRTREYVAADIEAIRSSPYQEPVTSSSPSLSYFGLTGGNIAFDYGMKTVRFGVQVDEAEAKHIASLINRRLGREAAV